MVPSNPLSSVDERTHVISHAGCSVSVMQTDLVPAVTAAGAATVVDVNQPWVRPDDQATRQLAAQGAQFVRPQLPSPAAE